jgi:hypothetical protein
MVPWDESESDESELEEELSSELEESRKPAAGPGANSASIIC